MGVEDTCSSSSVNDHKYSVFNKFNGKKEDEMKGKDSVIALRGEQRI